MVCGQAGRLMIQFEAQHSYLLAMCLRVDSSFSVRIYFLVCTKVDSESNEYTAVARSSRAIAEL